MGDNESLGLPEDFTDSFAYIAERDQALDHDRCFLCGVDLDTKERTDEHVFPKWLLRDFQLFNAKLHLLTGRTVSYGSLKIPCGRVIFVNPFLNLDIWNMTRTADLENYVTL